LTNTSPSNVTALDKHPCPACGAQAEWNPGKQKLVCPFCGTESPFAISTTGEIQELDLVKELVDYQEIKSPIRPQSLLPFKVTEDNVRDQMHRWYKSKWLAPGALKTRSLVDTVKGIYIPYWTFDAKVVCPWEAEAGHYYYTTESYTDGNGRTQTRQVQHVRWEPASGVVEHFFDDEPIPGTRGVSLPLLRQVEPFPTKQLVPYDTSYLSGFVVEHYQVVLVDAAKEAEDEMNEKLEQMCAAQIPGDTYRNLVINPTYSGRTFKHILVPIWLLTYTYGARAFQVIANGVTGRIAGQYPKSFWKVFFLVLGIIVFVLILMMMSSNR
jgi:hypothetical protein